jgi:hypothetical protein
MLSETDLRIFPWAESKLNRDTSDDGILSPAFSQYQGRPELIEKNHQAAAREGRSPNGILSD